MIFMTAMPQAARSACQDRLIPSAFVAGRAFAQPVAAVDHKALRLWVDSSGTGFLFDDVAERYKTVTSSSGMTERATLPAFSQDTTIPELATKDATLPVLRRADVANDPIFGGLDGQLGASWLQDHVWTFDYPHAKLWYRCSGSDPVHAPNEEIPLTFERNRQGKLAGGFEYPLLTVSIEGQQLTAALDTAASVALSSDGIAFLGGAANVRAASFATSATVAAWHKRHPQWRYATSVGLTAGIAAIEVPLVEAGSVHFDNVWFTTRPNDDVFEGEPVTLKVGPTAFGSSIVTIDYPRKRAIVQRTT